MVAECYGLNCVPQNTLVETVTPSVMGFGDGTLGKSLSLDEVVRVGLL